MSDGQRPTRQWVVTINGVEKIRLSPGQSIEIGRKPIRPLPDDGMVRLEVQDSTKSMSKRHASFIVDESGQARVRDLGSTNGSYVVQNDGDLIRVSEDSDYPLQHTSERFQFGDILVDFSQIDESQNAENDDVDILVPDLFSFAHEENDNAKEPDEADLSVDDILDLRAGEPTGIFHAEGVRSRISALHEQAVNQHQSESVPEQEKPQDFEQEYEESHELDHDGELQFQPLAAAQLAQESDEQEIVQLQESEEQSEPQQPTYKPAFEPGSVFDKVSKGDFDDQEQVIEVEGMTSEDAKNSTDFTLQFNMAKHSQLLPFLAMNPSLYDDLYAWLSAQGNEDIDSALEKNEGYREYLAAQE
ncbi:FHA domain-containing protein [Bombiscardovia coagulans]|uniref:Tfp pilus assembly protein n=1 Tax=Bombiscardovia coagulans TaxID=686666 RepID=A0A261EU22_9BIFI|nr:FHA domain-containing protein [Bombiscardovia coagulans]OZG50358.1 Tfp pilus assembly protein [Bombiscardovia coagulans]